jgi:hypothetical protein
VDIQTVWDWHIIAAVPLTPIGIVPKTVPAARSVFPPKMLSLLEDRLKPLLQIVAMVPSVESNLTNQADHDENWHEKKFQYSVSVSLLRTSCSR